LRNIRRNFEGLRITTVDSNIKVTTTYVITQPSDIIIREPVGTDVTYKKYVRENIKGTAYIKVNGISWAL
jgi:hypothetical protein